MVKSLVNRKGYDGILRRERNSQIGGHLFYYRYLRYFVLLPFKLKEIVAHVRYSRFQN